MENKIQLKEGKRYLIHVVLKEGCYVVAGNRGVEEIEILKETEFAYRIKTEDMKKTWVLKTDKIDVVEELIESSCTCGTNQACYKCHA